MTQSATVNLPMPDGDPLAISLPASDYPPETVLAAIAVYAETGNAREASRATNVPISTVNDWITSGESKQLIGQLRNAIRYNHASTINRIIGMSLARTLERLEHGDPVMTRQGTMRMIPVSARDSAVIGSMMIDKYQLLISGINEEQQSNRLESIAARLEAATSKLHANKANKPAIVDVIPEGVSSPEPPVS